MIASSNLAFEIDFFSNNFSILFRFCFANSSSLDNAFAFELYIFISLSTKVTLASIFSNEEFIVFILAFAASIKADSASILALAASTAALSALTLFSKGSASNIASNWSFFTYEWVTAGTSVT